MNFNIRNKQMSFTGSFIKSVKIKERHFLNYKDKYVNLVNMNINEYQDKNSLLGMINFWGYKSNVVHNLITDTEKTQSNILVLTTQEGDYTRITPQSILGIVQYKKLEDNSVLLYRIEKQPEFSNNFLLKKYKNIGRGLINSIIYVSKPKKITASVLRSAKGFYEKMNFVKKEGFKTFYELTLE